MALDVIQKVLDWLREGYPEGVPQQDYIPLLALLNRRLTEEEVTQVTEQMVQDGILQGSVNVSMIEEALASVTKQFPLESDIKRISDNLEKVGWVQGWVRVDNSTADTNSTGADGTN